jgi:hypothetical protein
MAEQTDRNFFGRLKKLFSTTAIVRVDGDGKRKVVDVDERQMNTNLLQLKDRYTKLQRSFYETHAGAQSMAYHQVRRELFRDYDAMDNDPIIASALDIYADESTTKNEYGEVLQIKSPNENVKEILENLFYDIMNVEFNLWPWTRNLTKYGDFFLGLEIAEGKGVINVIPQSVYYAERLEGYDPNNANSVKFKVEQDRTGKIEWENYEMAHFRLLSDTNFLPYGKSMIESGRRIWKQLTLMEDAMLIHRIMRAPEKRVFKIDIGNINPTEVDNYMQKIISKMKKIPFVDKNSGDYNLKYNMQNLTEDFFLPVRGGDSGTSIENLGGLEYAATEDIEFLQKKLFAALKVPKAYLSYDENVNGKCISPDTMIPLISGDVKSVAQLIDDYNNGILNYVYSLDEKTNNIVAGEIEWAGYTRLNTQVVKVWLDNGKYIECTPDHKFLTRDGEWIEAQHLTNGQSLMPLYLDNGGYKGNYTTVYEPSTGKYKLVHRIIAEQYNILSDGKVVHHVDFNSRNNNPDNLDCSMNFSEHRKYHSNHTKKTLNSPTQLKIRNDKFKLNNHFSIIGRLGGIKSGKRLGEWVKLNGPVNKQPDIYKECEVCGNDYKVNKCRYDIAKVCSRECYSVYLSDKMNNTVQYNQKYTNISYEYLLDVASKSISFVDLEKRIGVTRRTMNKIFDYYNINKVDFIYEHMPMSHNNLNFIKNYKKYEPTYKNHKVENVEWVHEHIDTCDLTIKTYHNFGTTAGVIIHNSTLAAEDVRFARTIERIQRTIVSELTKIAIVHLAAQGIEDSEMVNFELSLTNPSTIYEQEKVNLWSEKVRLATDMAGLKMLSKDWVYSNLFGMSDADRDEERVKIISDLKDAFRYTSIENEGNDPAEQPEPTKVEDELEELKQQIGNRKSGGEGGRPREGNTYGKDKHPYGRDPLGDKENHKERKRETFTNNNTKKIAREYINGMSAKKRIITEKKDFLDDKNLLDDSKF